MARMQDRRAEWRWESEETLAERAVMTRMRVLTGISEARASVNANDSDEFVPVDEGARAIATNWRILAGVFGSAAI
jgi:hypothetical protein